MIQMIKLFDQQIEALFKRRSIKNPEERYKNFKKLYESVGSPDLKYPSIHIAGTNGKGSVALKVAKSLELGGFRVGLFTSPHIHSFCERIAINGDCISEKSVLSGLEALKKFPLEDFHFFDITTLLGLNYFAEENVDIAIIETGLGGKFDATNVIEPILTAITTISMDHTKILGDSLEKIAREKAGIIKPYVPLVLGHSIKDLEVFEKARQLNVDVIQSKKGFQDFDESNQETARGILQYFSLAKEVIDQGVQSTPPFRFDVRGKMILDVAHNPEAFQALFEKINTLFPEKKIHLILGLSKEKEVGLCAKIIEKNTQQLYLCKMSHQALLTPLELEKSFTSKSLVIHKEFNLKQSAKHAKECDAILLIAGSFYMMDEVESSL
ncbi:MAG: hypothetical protein KAR79_06255, partial [Simkaniaceae bacterium]|nr:hypothetical protein [Simkaniaceae bacterium]